MILAGKQSRKMGRDKLLLDVGGAVGAGAGGLIGHLWRGCRAPT